MPEPYPATDGKVLEVKQAIQELKGLDNVHADLVALLDNRTWARERKAELLAEQDQGHDVEQELGQIALQIKALDASKKKAEKRSDARAALAVIEHNRELIHSIRNHFVYYLETWQEDHERAKAAGEKKLKRPPFELRNTKTVEKVMTVLDKPISTRADIDDEASDHSQADIAVYTPRQQLVIRSIQPPRASSRGQNLQKRRESASSRSSGLSRVTSAEEAELGHPRWRSRFGTEGTYRKALIYRGL
ncbi:hypothetical protein JCM10212_006388 [Sporobolomyces blumeae]